MVEERNKKAQSEMQGSIETLRLTQSKHMKCSQSIK